MNGQQSLVEVLGRFAERVNAHERIPRLLVGWDRTIGIEALDSGIFVSVHVRGQRVVEVAVGGDSDAAHVNVQGDEDVLKSIFEGVTNPAQAVLDGGLAVFGDEKDQVKLDAITLVLWGA